MDMSSSCVLRVCMQDPDHSQRPVATDGAQTMCQVHKLTCSTLIKPISSFPPPIYSPTVLLHAAS